MNLTEWTVRSEFYSADRSSRPDPSGSIRGRSTQIQTRSDTRIGAGTSLSCSGTHEWQHSTRDQRTRGCNRTAHRISCV